MPYSQTPKWISVIERKINWLAIPNIAIILVTLQAIGFLFALIDPVWINRLELIPEAVKAGEFWRLVTFLALPLSLSPIWVFFSLWFLYFVVNMIEEVWGAFQTTLYILISILLLIFFSFLFDYPITQISGFESTLFLAAATLFPEMEVQLFLVIPVKIKWLAWITIGIVLYHFLAGSMLNRLYLVVIYLNYLLFFGPALIERIKQKRKQIEFQRKMRR